MTHNRRSVIHGLAVTGVLVLSLVGCEKRSPSAQQSSSKPNGTAAPALANADAIYVVRGFVTELPDPASPTKELHVHHEPISDFKNAEGIVVGMDEMDMPFPVSDLTLLEAIRVGDVVEMTVSYRYEPVRPSKVTKLTKLPFGTTLNLKPNAEYIVRGKVAQVPDPKNPTTEFRVHHERIPDFKNAEGKVVGMNEMEMPFPVSDAKLLDGIQAGDLVEITFADWYKPIRTYKVTKLVKLPADTKLNLKD
jgi:Cu/Ag efflux protein CusF